MIPTIALPYRELQLLAHMFARFSRGYYVGRIVVEPHDGADALIQQRQLETVNKQLYAEGTGVERVDYPVIMKLWNSHFPVHGDDSVPTGTLLLPDWVIPDSSTDPFPTLKEVLLATPESVKRILDWGGDTPNFVAT